MQKPLTINGKGKYYLYKQQTHIDKLKIISTSVKIFVFPIFSVAKSERTKKKKTEAISTGFTVKNTKGKKGKERRDQRGEMVKTQIGLFDLAS